MVKGYIAIMQPFPDLPGFHYWPSRLDEAAQASLLAEIQAGLAVAPLYRPVTPGGKPFSVRMSNLGPLGWVSDRAGYRYQSTHPETGEPWPPIPTMLLDLWTDVCALAGPARLARHGIDRLLAGSSQRIPGGGRINLTLRRAA